jgi:L-alanine-DL-glutamate epimerase-like enolase superfamily enzyme
VRALKVDSQSTLTAWDVLAVRLVTDSGLEGWGYQCGFRAAMSALKVFVDEALLPELIGQDARMHKAWWKELYLLRHHIGLNGPAMQGVSAPEVAAWDLMAKAADLPLWMLLGGSYRRRIPCYNTNCGWLGYSLEELVDKVKWSVDHGFRAVKVKIGSEDFGEDLRRLEAVRQAVGPEVQVATDVNNRWDLQTALKCAPALVDLDIAWLEEPLYPFDVPGHAALAATIDTPLLHGENIYDPLMFRDMLDAGAIDIVQPSEMKLGGISRWLEVAALARAAGKRVVPAGWTMMQIDQHLAASVPHCWMVEWIPWILEIFQEPVQFEDGEIIIADAPGASTTVKPEALYEYAVS